MKFARYLQDTQIPEWKKAYIDYGGLKKQITAIRVTQQQDQREINDNADQGPEAPRSRSVTPPLDPTLDVLEFIPLPPLKATRFSMKSDSVVIPRVHGGIRRKSHDRFSLREMYPGLKLVPNRFSIASTFIGSRPARRAELLGPLPLNELLTLLTPVEAAFFTMLDAQLDKVESFYLQREKEILDRSRLLRMQLLELNEHRNHLFKARAMLPRAASITSAIKFNSVVRRTKKSVSDLSLQSKNSSLTVHSCVQSFNPVAHVKFDSETPSPTTCTPTLCGVQEEVEGGPAESRSWSNLSIKRGNKLKRKLPIGPGFLDPDPDGYFYAKRKLKKAVLEHYRGLELLHNYCVVNLTGFRKAVKKFEKVTKIPVQNQYMTEKVEGTAFASSKAIKEVMTQMEAMYAAAFLKGDRKTAIQRLRAGVDQPQTHYLSILSLGLYLGLSFPALVGGLFNVFRDSTRASIKGWSVLLYVYGTILVPVLFSLLVGLNLVAWVSTRINYVFIFELPASSHLDYRKYFEIPAILLSTLIYAFWLSFSEIGLFNFHIIDPTIWPLIWLGFAGLVLINPLPMMHRRSRYWFLRSIGRQFLSGLKPVEFTDFWLADQLCSMTFTLSNLSTIACVYIGRPFPEELTTTCGSSTNMWPAAFAITCLPVVMRLLQSLKRYCDSGKLTNLVNAAKYASAILADFFYFYWRHKNDRDTYFALWCLWSVFSSTFGCAWDLMMDWSLLSPHNAKNPLLRSNLVYENHVYTYYFAMVTNILVRFGWVFYIPRQGPNMMIRSFVLGMLEMLRRWQWNFFRLENEHLGNMDQYRVMREVPLPYIFDSTFRDEDEVEEDNQLRANLTHRTI